MLTLIMNGQMESHGVADEMLQAASSVRCAASGNCFIANPLERHLNARQDLWLPGVAWQARQANQADSEADPTGRGRKCVNAAAHAHKQQQQPQRQPHQS